MPAASDILQYFRGQLFQTPSLPNTTFAGKTVVITGANTGLGFECAKHLVQLGVSTLILGCRNLSKGEAAKEEILAGSRKVTSAVHVWQIDMANYASVMEFSERMRNELPRVDVLLANAGISTNQYAVSEGLESTLTVNVVSTFLLALLAIPQLENTAKQVGSPTHLTVTGSVVHCFAAHQELQLEPSEHILSALSNKSQANMGGRYFLSKLIVLQSVQEMASKIPRFSKSQLPSVVVNCPNPGWCKTELFRSDDGGFFARNLLRLIGRTSEVGARTLTSAIAGDVETHGRYLSECQVKPPSVFVRSQEGQETQRKLWMDLIEILEGISPGISNNLAGPSKMTPSSAGK